MEESSKDSCEGGTINPILQLGKQKQKGSWICPKPQKEVASTPNLAFSELVLETIFRACYSQGQRAIIYQRYLHMKL